MKQGIAIAAVLVLCAGGALAQDEAADVAAVEDTATAIDGAELSVVERWQADHTIIFDASEIVLADLLYVARPVIVFADNPNQPEFREQMQLIAQDMTGFDVRDVIVIVDTDPAARSAIRQELRPRGFNLVLIDKDGRVNLRKPEPWDVREISRQIDKMPLRMQEIREGG
jgi:hypothetical protein